MPVVGCQPVVMRSNTSCNSYICLCCDIGLDLHGQTTRRKSDGFGCCHRFDCWFGSDYTRRCRSTGALVIGAVSACVCHYASTVVKMRYSYDDSLDVVGVHGVGGLVGTLLVSVFASELFGGKGVVSIPDATTYSIVDQFFGSTNGLFDNHRLYIHCFG